MELGDHMYEDIEESTIFDMLFDVLWNILNVLAVFHVVDYPHHFIDLLCAYVRGSLFGHFIKLTLYYQTANI